MSIIKFYPSAPLEPIAKTEARIENFFDRNNFNVLNIVLKK